MDYAGSRSATGRAYFVRQSTGVAFSFRCSRVQTPQACFGSRSTARTTNVTIYRQTFQLRPLGQTFSTLGLTNRQMPVFGSTISPRFLFVGGTELLHELLSKAVLRYLTRVARGRFLVQCRQLLSNISSKVTPA
jgi:hypothetical protein